MYPVRIVIYKIEVFEMHIRVLSDIHDKFKAIVANSLMETLRVNTRQQINPSVDDSIRRPPRRGRGRQYMMQTEGDDSVPDIALHVNECSVNALLDTGSLETTILKVTVIQLGIRQYVNTEDKIMMRSASGHTFETLGFIEVCMTIWE